MVRRGARRSATLRVTVARMDGDPLYGLPAERLAELTGASLVTARRWKRTRALPPPVRRLLAILVTGDLGPVDSTWCGWHLSRGLLCGPDGLTFEPAEVLAIPFVRAQVNAYQVRQRFAVQADWIDGRYVAPDETQAPDAADCA